MGGHEDTGSVLRLHECPAGPSTLHVEATMKTTSALIATLLAVGAGMSTGAAAAGNGVVASATGSGQTTSGTQLRTFSFTARTDSSNNSSGQAELFNRN